MINKAILLGEIENTPEVNTLPNGTRSANFTLVTEERWTDRNTGMPRVKRERHKVAVFADKVIAQVEHLDPKTLVFVEGQIEGRGWTDINGLPKQGMDIVVRPMRGTIAIMEGYYEPDADIDTTAI